MRQFIFICTLFLFQSAYAITEEGDACRPQDRMSRSFVCFDGSVIDCSKPQGRVGYMFCTGLKLNELEREMNSAYRGTLRSFNRSSEDAMDYEAAKKALVESQNAWVRYAKFDCELGEALFGPGNAASPVALDCQAAHLKSRIKQLKELRR